MVAPTPGGSIPADTPSSTTPSQGAPKTKWGDRSIAPKTTNGDKIPTPSQLTNPPPAEPRTRSITQKQPVAPEDSDDDWDDDDWDDAENHPATTKDPKVAPLEKMFEEFINPHPLSGLQAPTLEVQAPPQPLKSISAEEGSEVFKWTSPTGKSIVIKPNAPRSRDTGTDSFQQTRAERGQAAYQIAHLAQLDGVVVPATKGIIKSFSHPDLQVCTHDGKSYIYNINDEVEAQKLGDFTYVIVNFDEIYYKDPKSTTLQPVILVPVFLEGKRYLIPKHLTPKDLNDLKNVPHIKLEGLPQNVKLPVANNEVNFELKDGEYIAKENKKLPAIVPTKKGYAPILGQIKNNKVDIEGRTYNVKGTKITSKDVPCLVQESLDIKSKWKQPLNMKSVIDLTISQLIFASQDGKLSQGDSNFTLDSTNMSLMFYDTDECFPSENESKTGVAVHKPGYLSLKETRKPLTSDERAYLGKKLAVLESVNSEILQKAKENGLSDAEVAALNKRLERLITRGTSAGSLQDLVFTVLPQVKEHWDELSKLVTQGVSPDSEEHIQKVAHEIGDVNPAASKWEIIRNTLEKNLSKDDVDRVVKALKEINPPQIALESFDRKADGLLQLVKEREKSHTTAIDEKIKNYVKVTTSHK